LLIVALLRTEKCTIKGVNDDPSNCISANAGRGSERDRSANDRAFDANAHRLRERRRRANHYQGHGDLNRARRRCAARSCRRTPCGRSSMRSPPHEGGARDIRFICRE
jgi:hypothetical protein